jgi:hypothetical protein
MKIRIYRQDNAWYVSFEGSMAMPFKHLDTVIEHLQRKYPGAEIVEPEPLPCQIHEEEMKPDLRLVKS